MADRQLRLGAFMRPVGIHTGWWRYPGAYPDANFNFEHVKRFAQTLERGKFDAFFMADHLAVLNMPIKALRRSATVTSFEPFTLLSALAGATERIGVRTVRNLADQSGRVVGNPKIRHPRLISAFAGQGPSSQQNRPCRPLASALTH